MYHNSERFSEGSMVGHAVQVRINDDLRAYGANVDTFCAKIYFTVHFLHFHTFKLSHFDPYTFSHIFTISNLKSDKLTKVAKNRRHLPKIANIYQKIPKLPSVAKSCQHLQKTCKKLPKIAISCQHLPKSTTICQMLDCQHLPKVAGDCQRLR